MLPFVQHVLDVPEILEAFAKRQFPLSLVFVLVKEMMEPAEVVSDPKALQWLYDMTSASMSNIKTPVPMDAIAALAAEASFFKRAKATLEYADSHLCRI